MKKFLTVALVAIGSFLLGTYKGETILEKSENALVAAKEKFSKDSDDTVSDDNSAD